MCLTVKVVPRVWQPACAVALLDLDTLNIEYYQHVRVIKAWGDTVSSRITAHGVIQFLCYKESTREQRINNDELFFEPV